MDVKHLSLSLATYSILSRMGHACLLNLWIAMRMLSLVSPILILSVAFTVVAWYLCLDVDWFLRYLLFLSPVTTCSGSTGVVQMDTVHCAITDWPIRCPSGSVTAVNRAHAGHMPWLSHEVM